MTFLEALEELHAAVRNLRDEVFRIVEPAVAYLAALLEVRKP